jgi:hypothetical protein
VYSFTKELEAVVAKEVIKDPKDVPQPPLQPKSECGETPLNGPPPAIRYASDEKFEQAHRKTSTLHAGLFRRLAK